MTLIRIKMKLHAEIIFIWKVSHLDSFSNRGTRELWNNLLVHAECVSIELNVLGAHGKLESSKNSNTCSYLMVSIYQAPSIYWILKLSSLSVIAIYFNIYAPVFR